MGGLDLAIDGRVFAIERRAILSLSRAGAIQLGLRPCYPLGRSLQRLARTVQCGLSAVEQVGRFAKLSRAVVQRGLPLGQPLFCNVLEALAGVGHAVALVRDPISFVRDSVSLIRDEVALSIDSSMVIELDAVVARFLISGHRNEHGR